MYLGSTLFNCYRIIIINMYYSQVFTEISRLDNLNSQNTLISLAIVRHLFWFKTALKPDVWLLPAIASQKEIRYVPTFRLQHHTICSTYLNRFLIDASNQAIAFGLSWRSRICMPRKQGRRNQRCRRCSTCTLLTTY